MYIVSHHNAILISLHLTVDVNVALFSKAHNKDFSNNFMDYISQFILPSRLVGEEHIFRDDSADGLVTIRRNRNSFKKHIHIKTATNAYTTGIGMALMNSYF